jgi:hypothetical protein
VKPVIALAMVGRTQVSFEVLKQWIGTLRQVYWPGPTFLMPEIYAAGAWIGVCPLRNLLTYQALKDPSWTHMLWLDADHKVDHRIFGRLEAHALNDPGIVVGCYYSRSYPFEVQAWVPHPDGDGFTFPGPQAMIPLLRHQQPRAAGQVLDIGAITYFPGSWPLLPVSAGGTGCMFMTRQLLEGMVAARGAPDVWRVDRMPWEATRALLDGGEDVSGVMTEDILFCLDARELLGVQTWLDTDPRMETGHVGEVTRDRRDYIAAHQVPAGIDLEALNADLRRRGYGIVEDEG